MAAIDSYFAVYNDDNILTIDDNYKNLVYAGTFYPNQYKKYNQRSQWVASDTEVYQYYYASRNKEYETLITFDLPDEKEKKNKILAFMPPPSEDVSYFCYRVKQRIFLMISVPIACSHGKSEDALKNFLSQIEYGLYAEAKLRKPQVGGSSGECGLFVYNAEGEVVFTSDRSFMQIQDYFFRSLDNFTNAEEVFKKITISCDRDLEIVPMTMSQYLRHTPQNWQHYRVYIKVITSRTVELSTRLYDLIPDPEAYAGGTIDLTTSFLLTRRL